MRIPKPHPLLNGKPVWQSRVRWAFIHTAMTIFLLDVAAMVFPAFAHTWDPINKFAVSIATAIVTFSEYFHHEESDPHG